MLKLISLPPFLLLFCIPLFPEPHAFLLLFLSPLIRGSAFYNSSLRRILLKSYKYISVQLLSHVWCFVAPWTSACQAPLSMGSPKQEYCIRLPFPSPADLPDPGTEPVSPALAGRFSTSEPPGKPTVHWQEDSNVQCFGVWSIYLSIYICVVDHFLFLFPLHIIPKTVAHLTLCCPIQ